MINITTIVEIISVISALGYIFLASQQNYLCWPVSIISCVGYTYLCFISALYLESALQFLYLAISVLGWITWQKKVDNLTVTTNSITINMKAIAALFFVGLLLGVVSFKFTNASLPFIDSMLFVFSIYATYLTAIKKLENWLYWIVIDFASIFVFTNRNLNITAALFFIYTVLAIKGYFDWKKTTLHETKHN